MRKSIAILLLAFSTYRLLDEYALLEPASPKGQIVPAVIQVEFYASPGCRPCERFVDDWKRGKFPDMAFTAKGVWDRQTHPIWRWHNGREWVWVKDSYTGPEWLDGIIKDSFKDR